MPTHTLSERRKRGLPTRRKARKILRHGQVGGRSLTRPQTGFFGVVAGGGRPTRLSPKIRRRGGR